MKKVLISFVLLVAVSVSAEAAIQTFSALDTGGSTRSKLNSNFSELDTTKETKAVVQASAPADTSVDWYDTDQEAGVLILKRHNGTTWVRASSHGVQYATSCVGIAAGMCVDAAGTLWYHNGTAVVEVGTGSGSYTLPTATGSVLGGVKVGSRLTITDGVLSADIQSGTGAVDSVNGQTGVVTLTIPTASTSAYNASTWNGSTSVPDQNAVRDYLVNFDADGDGDFTDETWYTAISGVSLSTENTWTAEQTFSAGIASSGTGAGSVTLTESTANGGTYSVTFTPGNLSANKTIAPENIIQISDIDTEAEFEALLFDLPEGGGASVPSAGIVTSNGTTLSSITPGTGVATALAAAVDGTGGLASKAALDAVVTGSFAFDTYPTYEDSAHSGSGIAVNGTTLAVYSASAGKWLTVGLTDSLDPAPVFRTLTVTQPSHGSITISDADLSQSISCGSTCSATTADGATVSGITAVPDSGYELSGWTGDLSGTTSPTSITMSANRSIGATFKTKPDNTVTFYFNADSATTGQSPQKGTGTITINAATAAVSGVVGNGLECDSTWRGSLQIPLSGNLDTGIGTVGFYANSSWVYGGYLSLSSSPDFMVENDGGGVKWMYMSGVQSLSLSAGWHFIELSWDYSGARSSYRIDGGSWTEVTGLTGSQPTGTNLAFGSYDGNSTTVTVDQVIISSEYQSDMYSVRSNTSF